MRRRVLASRFPRSGEAARGARARDRGVGTRRDAPPGVGADLDAWRIFRSDGTDVLYAMPRATLTAQATTRAEAIAIRSRPPSRLRTPRAWRATPSRRSSSAGLSLRPASRRRCLRPPPSRGSCPILIDYALAKGLAHEAFGHAAEADGFRSSVLARDGRFRVGERVGTERISIIDEPIAGDHAWQP